MLRQCHRSSIDPSEINQLAYPSIPDLPSISVATIRHPSSRRGSCCRSEATCERPNHFPASQQSTRVLLPVSYHYQQSSQQYSGIPAVDEHAATADDEGPAIDQFPSAVHQSTFCQSSSRRGSCCRPVVVPP